MSESKETKRTRPPKRKAVIETEKKAAEEKAKDPLKDLRGRRKDPELEAERLRLVNEHREKKKKEKEKEKQKKKKERENATWKRREEKMKDMYEHVREKDGDQGNRSRD
jgi:hypothetical protein